MNTEKQQDNKPVRKKTFSTTIEESVSKKFKLHCVANGQNMSEVLTQFMLDYIKNNPIK